MKIDEEKFLAHSRDAILYHQSLIRDNERNQPFLKALKRVVNSTSRVLDIGSGSGIWAVTAAKLGAGKVTAIEGNPVMIPVILAHIRENGVGDRVEVVHGNSKEINLRHKYDVIVSETIGNQAFDEGIINTMADARRRFLAADGVMIPQTVSLMAAPAFIEPERQTPVGVPMSVEYLRRIAVNFTFKMIEKNEVKLLADPFPLLETDLREINSEPDYTGMIGRWQLRNVSRANAFVLWARSQLLDGIDLDTWGTKTWTPIVCPFEPIPIKGKGQLELSLNINAKQYHWTVRVPSAKEAPIRSYSPMFAYAKLKFDMKLAPRKRKARKLSK